MAAAVNPRAGRRAVVMAALAPLLLTACGTGAGTPKAGHGHGHGRPAANAAAASGHNDADVMFLQMMIEHHRQGLEMAGLAAGRAPREEVRRLAAAVKATQADEVRTMRARLGRWGKPTTVDHAPNLHADHGGMPATSPKEIRALRGAKGAEFENAFLNLFLAHQHNAVKMARTETSKGGDAETRAFAQRVVESRSDQIRQMLGLLNA
ncbi:DUF305 domain-containing protein [Actinomadura kijaniata]|uniref:DUF305 domain-containing protein n=1 Tax=Actinomadura kijaniata TaxID=46161 RepID=UPI003F19E187